MNKRQALGKGLGALISTQSEPKDDRQSGISQISISKIIPNRFQPRKTFNNESISELAQSIKEKGILQPVIVTKSGDNYELVVGERRFRAATQLQLQEIPCIIRDLTDVDRLELALIENIQREDLNPIEEAESIHILLKKLNCTHEILSQKLGLSRAAITNKLRLLNLPDIAKEQLINENISAGHARALLALSKESHIADTLDYIENNSLSVRKTEELIQYINENDKLPNPDKKTNEPEEDQELEKKDKQNNKIQKK